MVISLIAATIMFFFAMRQREHYEAVLLEYEVQKEQLKQNRIRATQQEQIAQKVSDMHEHELLNSDSLKVALAICK